MYVCKCARAGACVYCVMCVCVCVQLCTHVRAPHRARACNRTYRVLRWRGMVSAVPVVRARWTRRTCRRILITRRPVFTTAAAACTGGGLAVTSRVALSPAPHVETVRHHRCPHRFPADFSAYFLPRRRQQLLYRVSRSDKFFHRPESDLLTGWVIDLSSVKCIFLIHQW